MWRYGQKQARQQKLASQSNCQGSLTDNFATAAFKPRTQVLEMQ
jgi:hypothetical protein